MEILNMPRTHKRALRFCPDGQINIRQRIVRLLDLKVGDSIMFCRMDDGRVYIYKDNDHPLALRLRGRNCQLSAQSVNTVEMIYCYIEGLTAEKRKQPVELLAFNRKYTINVDGVPHEAVNIINRI